MSMLFLEEKELLYTAIDVGANVVPLIKVRYWVMKREKKKNVLPNRWGNACQCRHMSL